MVITPNELIPIFVEHALSYSSQYDFKVFIDLSISFILSYYKRSIQQ